MTSANSVDPCEQVRVRTRSHRSASHHLFHPRSTPAAPVAARRGATPSSGVRWPVRPSQPLPGPCAGQQPTSGRRRARPRAVTPGWRRAPRREPCDGLPAERRGASPSNLGLALAGTSAGSPPGAGARGRRTRRAARRPAAASPRSAAVRPRRPHSSSGRSCDARRYPRARARPLAQGGRARQRLRRASALRPLGAAATVACSRFSAPPADLCGAPGAEATRLHSSPPAFRAGAAEETGNPPAARAGDGRHRRPMR